jgi:hypothetical protein
MMTQMQLFQADPVALLGTLGQFGVKIELNSYMQMMLRNQLIEAIKSLPAETLQKVKTAIMFASFGKGGAGGMDPSMLFMMGGFGGDSKGGNPMEQYMKMQMMQSMMGGAASGDSKGGNPMEQYMKMQMMQSMMGGASGNAGGFDPTMLFMMGGNSPFSGMFGGGASTGAKSSAY